MTQSRFDAFALSLARARHRGFATLAALAIALAGAGCGGKNGTQLSKIQYEARIQKDSDDIREAFRPLSTPPSSLRQFARDLKTGQQKLRQAADDLTKATPPNEVARDNKTLVAGLRKLAALLEPLRAAALKRDVAGVQRAANDLQGSDALKDAQDATNDMKKKGYKLGSLGG